MKNRTCRITPALVSALWLLASLPAYSFWHGGSASLGANPAGADLAQQYEHGRFNEASRHTDSLPEDSRLRSSAEFPDAEAGVVFCGYRYYNASTGRWLSRDPIGESGGENQCAFVGNDPIDLIDYLGLAIECSCPESYLDANGLRGQYVKQANRYSAKPGTSPTLFDGKGDAEILWRMLSTKHIFKVQDLKVSNLKEHVEARATIVKNARRSNFGWRDEGTKIYNPTGKDAAEILKNLLAYWAKHPEEFFDAVNNKDTKIGCHIATEIIFESGNHHRGAGKRPNDLIFVPGDWPYITNQAYDRQPKDWDPGFEGENLIHLGNVTFWGHPSGIMSDQRWFHTIRNEWKSLTGKPGDPAWGSHGHEGPPSIRFPLRGLQR